MALPPRIIVHSLAHAMAAAAAAGEAGVSVTLMSAPGAGAYMGSPWFRHVIDVVTEAYPTVRIDAVLDCGEEAGYALAALGDGIMAVRIDGRSQALAALTDIAAQLGARVETEAVAQGQVLDLRHHPDPASACQAWVRLCITRGPTACT